MKKILLTVLAVTSMQVAFAQKGAIRNAENNLNSGALTKAQTEIDKAVAHDKTKDDPKAWYLRGVIYTQMLTDQVFSAFANDKTHETAIESFKKVEQLEGGNGEFSKKVPEQRAALGDYAFNKGVEFYNNPDEAKKEANRKEALRYWTMTSELNPKNDSTAVFYSAIVAQELGDNKTALNYYNTMIQKGYAQPTTYFAIADMQRQMDASDEEINKTIQAGLKQYPDNVDLMLMELDYLIRNQRDDEAFGKIERAIKADPSNPNLHLVLGNLNDKKKQTEAAAANYKRVLELDPNNFDAYFNLAVGQFNKGVEFDSQASKMDYATYQKKGKALEAQAKKHYETALPYFEKAYTIQPEDQRVVRTLTSVYTRLGRKDDAAKYDKLLKN